MDSLSGRLTLAVAVVLAGFLGLAGTALDRAFQESVEAGVQQHLQAQVYLLLGAAELDAQGRLNMPAAVAEPRLGAPDSGLYAAIRDADGHILWRSASSVGRDIPYPAAGPPGQPVHRRITAGDGTALHALAYPVSWEVDGGGRRLDFLVAESVAGAQAQVAGFRRTLWTWFAGIAVVLLAVQAAVLRWGLSPLRRAAREIAHIEAGQQDRLGRDYPRELRPLTRNLNDLIATGRQRLQRYRDGLSDLAHSLKTPLAVLRSIGRDPALGETGAAIREQAERMDRAVAWHLQRAAAAGRGGLARAVPLADVARRVAASLAKIYAERALRIEVDVPADTVFTGDPEDLMEILGNLLDNACKWSRGRVRARAHTGPAGELVLVVEDDGPGIPEDQREAVLERGVRIDEMVPGEGIGLAIVRQMVQEAYGGQLTLARSGLGGLQVVVSLAGDALTARGQRGS